MVQIKGHRHKKERRREQSWPRKYVPAHTQGKCPYCKKKMDNIEAHVHARHLFEKKREIKGIRHGHG